MSDLEKFAFSSICQYKICHDSMIWWSLGVGVGGQGVTGRLYEDLNLFEGSGLGQSFEL